MAFDAQGFRKAALQAGIPKQQVEQAIAQRTGVKGWLTGGKQGLGGIVSGIGNILNLPSYAIGGFLNQLQRGFGSQYGQQTDATGLGILEGIKSKRGLMTEAPETLGIDPSSGLGKAVGFGAELLVPMPPVGKALRFARGADAVSDASKVGLFARGSQKLGRKLTEEGESLLTRGLGNPKALEKAKGVSPVSMRELFSKYNLYDRAPETFGDAARTANVAGKAMLESAPASINTRRIVQMFDDEIAKLSKNAKTSTKAQQAVQELANRKQMFLEGIQNPNISTPLMSDAGTVYDIKSAFQGDLPPSSFGMPTSEIGKNLGTKKAYQTLLSGIEEQAPGIKNIGREQSALLKLQEIAKASEARGAARQNVNFSKLGSAGVGGLVAGVPGAVGGFVAERIANSPQFLASTSKAYSKVGNMLQSGVNMPRVTNPALRTGMNIAGQAVRRTPVTALRTQAMPTPKNELSVSQAQMQLKSPTYNNIVPQGSGINYNPYKKVKPIWSK